MAITADEAYGRMVAQRIGMESRAELYRRSLEEFTKDAWRQVEPRPYTPGWHLSCIAEHLQAVSHGEIRRLIINIPPRHSKSMSVAVMWPAWEWTFQPEAQWLFSSYSQSLAFRDAYKMRVLIQSEWYQAHFGQQSLHEKTVDIEGSLISRIRNSAMGYRITTSVGGATTGEGGSRLVIDDPHNTRDVYSDAKRQAVLEWWDTAMNTRLNDPRKDAKVIVGQRSHDNDLFGHILEREHGWVHLNLPMEFVPSKRCSTVIGFADPRKEEGELICPERIGHQELDEYKATMTERDVSAQFQQEPTGSSGLIIKREWWRKWPHEKPPPCLFVLQFMDTAFEEREEDDYSARTTWGVFQLGEGDDTKFHCILLERMRERLAFPDLRERTISGYHQFKPDWLFVEKKASGHSLIQELRKAGVPVRGVPKRIDKVSAMHFASIVPEKGRAWYMDRAWSQDVINEVCKFPMAEHDDVSDTCAMAWAWLRRRNEIGFDDEADENGDVDLYKPARPVYG